MLQVDTVFMAQKTFSFRYFTIFYTIRLLTASQFDALEESTVPEIQRSNLCSVALTMLSIGVNDILAFDFMDSPGREDMKSALRQLRLLGALTPEDQLTLRGRRMATFPIEPRLTAAILAASELGCTEEVLTIAILVATSLFYCAIGFQFNGQPNMWHMAKVKLDTFRW